MEKVPALLEYAARPARRPVRWAGKVAAGCMFGFIVGGTMDAAIAIPAALIQPSDAILRGLADVDIWIVLLPTTGGAVFGLCHAFHPARCRRSR